MLLAMSFSPIPITQRPRTCIGAADDVMIDGADIEMMETLESELETTGSDSMYLVNTSIKTGGNLAVGSLGTLNISSANFSVGQSNESHI